MGHVSHFLATLYFELWTFRGVWTVSPCAYIVITTEKGRAVIWNLYMDEVDTLQDCKFRKNHQDVTLFSGLIFQYANPDLSGFSNFVLLWVVAKEKGRGVPIKFVVRTYSHDFRFVDP